MTAPVIAIVGATATGKTEFALAVCEAIGNAEIVSADAFQLYRGMDIGTAKLPIAQRRNIIHHQIDVLDIDEEASVAAYQKHARADIAAIRARGNIAVVCGGSGLYLRALLDDLTFPGTDARLRQEITRWANQHGEHALHQRLHRLDPVSATKIPANNVRRVIRAVEVCELTGQPFSATLPKYRYVTDTIQFGLYRDQNQLAEAIEHRSAKMVTDGLLTEVRNLQARGLAETPTASRATGYPQALQVLAGDLELTALPEAITNETKKLAKRQYKWFKRDPRIAWFNPTQPQQWEQMLKQACAAVS